MKQDHTIHPSDDNFDIFLTKHLQQAQTYLPDDDFTARVINQLPAPKKLARWQERLIIMIPLVVISLLVLSQFSVLAVFIKLWVLLLTAGVTGLLQVGILTTIAVVSGATFWFAKQLRII
jgi:antibiotic biosynthesis monooxygenase (ABM) superfamily enzyme